MQVKGTDASGGGSTVKKTATTATTTAKKTTTGSTGSTSTTKTNKANSEDFYQGGGKTNNSTVTLPAKTTTTTTASTTAKTASPSAVSSALNSTGTASKATTTPVYTASKDAISKALGTTGATTVKATRTNKANSADYYQGGGKTNNNISTKDVAVNKALSTGGTDSASSGTIAKAEQTAARQSGAYAQADPIIQAYAQQLIANDDTDSDEATNTLSYTNRANKANTAGYYQGGGKYASPTTKYPNAVTIAKDKLIGDVDLDEDVSSTTDDETVYNKANGPGFYKGGGKYDDPNKIYTFPEKVYDQVADNSDELVDEYGDEYGDDGQYGSDEYSNEDVQWADIDSDVITNPDITTDEEDSYLTEDGTISTDELIQQIVNQLTGEDSELISPDVLTWAQAYAQALSTLGGTYDAELQSALDDLKNKALKSGFYGQSNYDMMVAKAIQSGELEKNTSVASLAQELVGQSKEDAQNTIENWINNKQITVDGLYDLLALVAKYNNTTEETTSGKDEDGNSYSQTTKTKTYM